MSQQQDNSHPTGGLSDDGQQALSVLRDVWDAQDQTSADIDEACGNTKSCKSMHNVGFDAYGDENDAPSDGQAVDNSLRSGWKKQLEREGKLGTGTKSIRDLVLGSDPKH